MAACNGSSDSKTPVPADTGAGPRVLLGPGFLGGWRRPAGLLETYARETAALGHTPLLADLEALAARVPQGGVLAGYLSYEAAAAFGARGLLPPPPGFAGRRLPGVWAGLYAGHEAAAPPPSGPVPTPVPVPAAGRDAYEAAVGRVVAAILAGDLFQANLSRRLSAVWDAAPDPEALFGRLCGGSAAAPAYAAMIALGDGAVLSASPELFLAVDGDRVAAEPIKGTRPRGPTAAADRRLAGDLLASAKDRAENVMIADLMRNDLSRVARDGSVRAPAVCALRSLPHVHHLYSRIEAVLAPGTSPFAALAAAFPCGSITGAPKPAAMRAIAAEEREGRGPYCGTVFAVRPGHAVFSVPIRTGVLTYGDGGARLDMRVGGGVTALSDPAEEWSETEDKAYGFAAMTGLPGAERA